MRCTNQSENESLVLMDEEAACCDGGKWAHRTQHDYIWWSDEGKLANESKESAHLVS